MNAGKWLDTLPITNSTIFAYAMNNYWYTNYKAGQDGNFTFRFALTSADATDPATAARFGESVSQPLRAIYAPPATSAPNRPLPPSLVQLEPPNVIVTACKIAEDDHGLILRLRETAGRDTTARLRFAPNNAYRATRCDLVERDRQPMAIDDQTVAIEITANSMAAIRLIPE
jgi:alpha-mannosidase